ncbi:hypothetical protein YPPY66_1807 [Yersinia pestis PY-66]|uniref:Uncharacterized protein n=3 Tax=Yersinia pseudotuberculosis complex TaxID=1649845 RepID=A0A0U1QWU3_YERP3|nr:hypothetical protein YpsIP31758_2615 [Yersinia pseudotuberculosis IP 31758]ABX88356.1 hypothetical protein YpAngola_A1593 [Yersinia pestis Angola]EDR31773.1 hypothetical protein YPIP275_3830 [Yersinia pestis biovar Orientalis str. IP275]EDR40536.1 hypothetical protein YpF1991016_0310 [Yersinia pestis biovar Orientalis str. F1991016]EDR43538.1 hypothetical protein YpE1979001_2624 [Yersinia pestis biovar Antiqua str. E1979001]EDR51987.1 hypothetical protein YpB42003004_2391 [Yersinia pestis b
MWYRAIAHPFMMPILLVLVPQQGNITVSVIQSVIRVSERG